MAPATVYFSGECQLLAWDGLPAVRQTAWEAALRETLSRGEHDCLWTTLGCNSR